MCMVRSSHTKLRIIANVDALAETCMDALNEMSPAELVAFVLEHRDELLQMGTWTIERPDGSDLRIDPP